MSAEPISATVTAGVAAGTTGITFATMFPEATPAVMLLLSSWGGSLRLEQRGPQALEANTVCAYLIYRWGLLRRNSI